MRLFIAFIMLGVSVSGFAQKIPFPPSQTPYETLEEAFNSSRIPVKTLREITHFEDWQRGYTPHYALPAKPDTTLSEFSQWTPSLFTVMTMTPVDCRSRVDCGPYKLLYYCQKSAEYCKSFFEKDIKHLREADVGSCDRYGHIIPKADDLRGKLTNNAKCSLRNGVTITQKSEFRRVNPQVIIGKVITVTKKASGKVDKEIYYLYLF